MNFMNAEERSILRQNLFRDLRVELGHLKTCQTSLFLFGISGSGLFLGLINANIVQGSIFGVNPGYLILVILVLLLPLWIIYFDKARTIARIVGFLRVQERLFLSNSSLGIIGWESAMKKYWQNRKLIDDRYYDGFFDELFPKDITKKQQEDKRNKIYYSTYWFSVYSMFFLFNLVCLVISGYFININGMIKFWLLIWFILVFGICFLNTKYKFFNYMRNTFKKWLEKDPPSHTDLFSIMRQTGLMVILCWLGLIGYLWYTHSVVIDIVQEFTNLLQVTSSQSFECIPIIIYSIALALFIIVAISALWMLQNLVKKGGRYNYGTFEKRWEFILEIQFITDNRVIKRPLPVSNTDDYNDENGVIW